MKDQSLILSEQTVQKIRDREILKIAKARGITLDRETGVVSSEPLPHEEMF